MLIQADHDRLVEELYKLRDTYGWEVNVVTMDKMSRAEQLRLSGRTTVRSFPLLLSYLLKLMCACCIAGYAGRTRQRSDIFTMDETDTTKHSHGILLPWRLRARLRVHDARVGNDALRVLGRQVRLSSHPPFEYRTRTDCSFVCSAFTRPDVPPVAYPDGF